MRYIHIGLLACVVISLGACDSPEDKAAKICQNLRSKYELCLAKHAESREHPMSQRKSQGHGEAELMALDSNQKLQDILYCQDQTGRESYTLDCPQYRVPK